MTQELSVVVSLGSVSAVACPCEHRVILRFGKGGMCGKDKGEINNEC